MPTKTSEIGPSRADRRQPLWPWLVLPLVALALFLALRSFRQAMPPAQAPAGVTPVEELTTIQ